MSTDLRAEHDAYRLGDCLIEPGTGHVQQNGRAVHLEPKAVDLLCYLLDRPGEIVSQEELLEAVWPGRVVEPTAITRNMAQIRRALGDSAKSPAYIETIPKRGYRTIAEVQAGATSNGILAPDLHRNRSRPRILAIALAVGLLLRVRDRHVQRRPIW